MMTNYDRAAAGVAAAALLLLVIVGAPRHYTPETVPPVCGVVQEDGETVPASCYTVAELDARLDAIHAERSGGRFTDDYAECAELLDAGDPDAGTCHTRYATLDAPEEWGADRDPETADTAVRP